MLLHTIEDGVRTLSQGGVLLYPTETYFAMGCRISDEAAITRVFQLKKRLFAMPLPVIIADTEQLYKVAQLSVNIQVGVQKLIEAFWPGPLTLVVPAKTHISALLSGGTGNIALRVSLHPVARQLSKLLDEPIVSSSANISGQVPVANVDDLHPDLVKKADVLNLPPVPQGGLPSTLVEPLDSYQIKIHRPGVITEAALISAGFVISK